MPGNARKESWRGMRRERKSSGVRCFGLHHVFGLQVLFNQVMADAAFQAREVGDVIRDRLCDGLSVFQADAPA